MATANVNYTNAMDKAKIESDAKMALDKKRTDLVNSNWFNYLWRLWAYNHAKRAYDRTKEDSK